jgi:3',5'-cyclic AMP phosphodiesterase CpdA
MGLQSAQGSRWFRLFLGLGIAIVLANFLPSSLAKSPRQPQVNPPQASPVIVAAGDIACTPQSAYFNQGKGKDDNCQMQATANLVLNNNPKAVLVLGDNQYEKGELENFQKSYDPTWGRFKHITKPVPGNHEYVQPQAAGYYDYFGKLAGDRRKGYYSFNLGNWHLIALNSNCEYVGGCNVGSPQEKWLKADLKANTKACTLAYWHHPRFSSGLHGNNKALAAFWQDLYEAGAELVLSGHDHDYERFAPQDLNEKLDSQKGIRQFVVGSGGKSLYPFKTIRANSEVRNNDTYGVLKLSLNPQSYAWEYQPIPGSDFKDQGKAACH